MWNESSESRSHRGRLHGVFTSWKQIIFFFKEITIMAWGRSQLQYLLPCNTPNYPLHAATAGGIPAPAFTVPKVNSVAS